RNRTAGDFGPHLQNGNHDDKDNERYLLPRRPPRQPSQRPVVEQEERYRQRDRHWLAEERHDEREEHEQVARPSGRARVARIGGHRDEPEESNQDVLSLRHPRDRLDVKRMESEERGNRG